MEANITYTVKAFCKFHKVEFEHTYWYKTEADRAAAIASGTCWAGLPNLQNHTQHSSRRAA